MKYFKLHSGFFLLGAVASLAAAFLWENYLFHHRIYNKDYAKDAIFYLKTISGPIYIRKIDFTIDKLLDGCSVFMLFAAIAVALYQKYVRR